MRSHPILRGYIAVLLCSLIACLPASAGTIVYKEGNTIVFNPSTTIAGINVGAQSTDPSAPVNGDIWYKTGTGFRIRTEGTTVTLGAGGSGSGDALTTNPLSQFAATTSAQLKGVLSDELGDASGKAIFSLGTLAISSGKTLTSSNTLTLAGTDGSTLNIGAGGTLGAAALLGTSAGGNGTADNGKAAIFGTGGIFDVTTELTVHNAANAAHAYLSDDGTLGFHAVGETNPRELAFPSDVLEGESKEIATRNWVTAQGYSTGSGTGDLVSTNNLSDVNDAALSRANLGAAGTGVANTFSAQNVFSLNPRVPTTDLGTNLASGTALTLGTNYYGTISSAKTLTFSGTASEGIRTSIKLTVTNAPILTIPSSKRGGEANSAITTVQLSNGVHNLTWEYRGGEYILFDTIGRLDNLAGTTAPTANEDIGDGYTVGSVWIDTTNDVTYTCVDETVTAAVWRKTSTNATDTESLTNKTLTDASNTLPCEIGVALSDETTDITTGTAKVTIRMPYAMTVTAVRASVNTVSSSGTPTVDINDGGTTILSTKLTIDASEKTSTTAAAAAVISDTALADDAEITFDIDTAGTGAKGLKVWIIGTR